MLRKVQNDSLNRLAEIHKPKSTISKLKQYQFRHKYVKASKEMHIFYTGVTKQVFKWILQGLKEITSVVCKKLCLADHLFLILTKLRLGLTNKDLAYRFRLSVAVVSRIYRRLLPKLAQLMAFLVIWPEKPALRKYLPKCFRGKYTKCVCIIDCTEIFIERPLSLNTRAQTWSNYKNHNTIKYLIACTPAGAVSFISEGWGGRVSDKRKAFTSSPIVVVVSVSNSCNAV